MFDQELLALGLWNAQGVDVDISYCLEFLSKRQLGQAFVRRGRFRLLAVSLLMPGVSILPFAEPEPEG